MTGPGVLIVFYLNFFLLCGVALRHWFKFIAQVRLPFYPSHFPFWSHRRCALHGAEWAGASAVMRSSSCGGSGSPGSPPLQRRACTCTESFFSLLLRSRPALRSVVLQFIPYTVLLLIIGFALGLGARTDDTLQQDTSSGSVSGSIAAGSIAASSSAASASAGSSAGSGSGKDFRGDYLQTMQILATLDPHTLLYIFLPALLFESAQVSVALLRSGLARDPAPRFPAAQDALASACLDRRARVWKLDRCWAMPWARLTPVLTSRFILPRAHSRRSIFTCSRRSPSRRSCSLSRAWLSARF